MRSSRTTFATSWWILRGFGIRVLTPRQPATVLENQLHRKLNHAWIAIRGLDSSKARRCDRSGWRSEIHHVKRVEEFAPNLHVQALGNEQALVHGEVHVALAGTTHGIPAHVAEQIARTGKR